MLQPFRQLALELISKPATERRTERKTRTGMLPARLTDLYRERLPVTILDVSQAGLGLKVQELFVLDFPVLIECDGLLIIGNVRHCMRAATGGYIMMLKIQKIVDTTTWESPSLQLSAGIGMGF